MQNNTFAFARQGININKGKQYTQIPFARRA